MKMAKASKADLDMALDLIGVLDYIERGHFPFRFSDPDNEATEWLDPDDAPQMANLLYQLKRLLNRGSIGRVIMGMAVICDPQNECIDPDADCIEHHPKRQQMEDALLWTLYHHQGGSSHIGQPIRKLLGIGQHDRLTDEQIAKAKAFGGAANQIFSTCEGSKCPSKDNCRRHTERKHSESVPAALWIRREAGTSACDMYQPINAVSTFKD